MSTAVASAPTIGVRNGNLMHGQRLSHARRVAVGARPGRVAPRTMAFIPNLIPNPFHRWGACVIPTLSSEPWAPAAPVPQPASISWRSYKYLAPTVPEFAPKTSKSANQTNAPGGATSTTGDDANPNAPPDTTLRGMLAAKHDKWQVGHENGYDESDTVWRKFRCRNKAKGHELLEAVQDELYVPNEQGCRIRRESQGMFYMCCDGVRVRLNETKSEVLVEVPLPRETNAEISACDKTLKIVEDLAKKSGCKV